MARLPDELLTTILSLQRRLLEELDEARAVEFAIFEVYGEVEATFTVLEQLQNAAERLRTPYSRFCSLLLVIAEAQPTASNAVESLLLQTIEQAQAATDAVKATIREVKRDFNLP